MRLEPCKGCSAYYLSENLIGGLCYQCRAKGSTRTSPGAIKLDQRKLEGEATRLEKEAMSLEKREKRLLAESDRRLKEYNDKRAKLSERERTLAANEKGLRARTTAVTSKEQVVARNFEIIQRQKASLETETRTVAGLRREALKERDRAREVARKNATEAKRLADENKRLVKGLRDLGKREEKLDRKEEQLKKLEAKLRKRPPTCKELREDHAKLTRKLERTEDRVGQLRSELAGWNRTERVLDWMSTELGGKPVWPYREPVVAVGEGPYSRRQINRYLAGHEFDTARAGSPDARIMIVGRDGWREQELEKQIEVRQGEELRVYSQELFLLTLALCRDPLDECEPKILIDLFGRGHPALEFLIRTELTWPNTEPGTLPDKPREWGVDETPLHMMGYKVGEYSELDAHGRHAKLKQAFEIPEMPFVHSDDYMAEWGEPRTARRLWRMAHHVAREARRRDPRKKLARRHWISDLAWMKKELFRGSMKFRWPSTRVP